MHWIARHILKRLAFADSVHYAELVPDGVEGNLFQYYARDLEKKGLISREAGAYSLTDAGRRFVADLSQTKQMATRTQPRVMVAVAARNDAGEWLLFKWRRHPYRGLVSLPMGRQFRGRTATEMAAEQLRDKTGYGADLTALGVVDLITEGDHLLIQVFRADNLRGEHGSDGLTGVSFWGRPAEIAPGAAVAGFAELIGWIEDENRAPLYEIDSR